MLPKLYGYDTKGKIKVWWATVEGDIITIHHGQDGGKIQTKDTICKAKNVGRSNETTPEQQAISEAQSKWNKQIDKGYAENIEDADKLELPMLAHDYNKHGHRINYPCDVSPKLDGVRCLCYIDTDVGTVKFKSRGGKDYPVPEHLKEQLLEIATNSELSKYKLDGELYIHGMLLQDIVSCAKKENGNTKDLTYCIFDLPTEDLTWELRLQQLENDLLHLSTHVSFVSNDKAYTEEEMKILHDEFVQEGYEGCMIRNHDAHYTFGKRNAGIQKYKEFMDEEFEVVGYCGDKNGECVFRCKTTCGGEFDVKMKGTHEQRAYQLSTGSKFIGKMMTVKFQAWTKDKLPQFPVALSMRDYE